MADNQLGDFLLRCREALRPTDVGLPAGPRRRVPGLRREEVAILSGISAENITKIEQGRNRHPSPETLAKLADALQLTLSQRVYVYERAKAVDPHFNSVGGSTPNRCVRSPVKRMLAGFKKTTAAVVVNRVLEILDYTYAFERVFGPLGVLDDGPNPPNFMRYICTDPRARRCFPEWETLVDEAVAIFKRGPRSAVVDQLINELTLKSGTEFTERLEKVPGLARESLIMRVIHPEVGHLSLRTESLTLPTDDDQQLVLHMPENPATAQMIHQLVGDRPTTLLSEPDDRHAGAGRHVACAQGRRSPAAFDPGVPMRGLRSRLSVRPP